MNLTLSADEQIVRRARRVARAMGKSLNQLVREHLAELAAMSDPQRDIDELRKLSARSRGRSHGWRFNRDDLYERP